MENKYGCAHRCVNLLGSAYCVCHKGYRRQADGKSCEDIDECLNPEVRAVCAHGCWNTNGSYVCRKEPDATTTKGHSFQTADEVEESGYGDYGYDKTERDRTPSAACSSGFARVESGCIGAASIGHMSLPAVYICGAVFSDATTSTPCVSYTTTCTKKLRLLGEIRPKIAPPSSISSTYCNTQTSEDIDECAERTLNCSHNCTNVVGSAFCSCPLGFKLMADNRTCVDIDECATVKPCSDVCVNTKGSFNCVCLPGRVPHDSAQRYCKDCPRNTFKNDASSQCDMCPPHSHTNGTRKAAKEDCVCSAGYRRGLVGGEWCVDIDECAERTLNCSHNCTNVVGSAFCSCPLGFKLMADNLTCVDIDECATVKPCSDVCVNTKGSFNCVCLPGRVPHDSAQRYCKDCPRNTFKNDASSQCDMCPPHSHTNGTRKASKEDCVCSAGYRRGLVGGEWCVDIDECAERTLNCSHNCTNVVGSAFCSCPLGFKLMADNLTCVDSNECEENPRICSQLCTNTHGSYKCSCKPGYTLSASDSYQCIAVTCPMFVEASNSVTTCDPPVVDSSAAIGTWCYVRCNAGFYLEGSSVTNCTMQGTWTHGPPTCEENQAAKCTHPTNLFGTFYRKDENGNYLKIHQDNSFDHEAVIYILCDKGSRFEQWWCRHGEWSHERVCEGSYPLAPDGTTHVRQQQGTAPKPEGYVPVKPAQHSHTLTTSEAPHLRPSDDYNNNRAAAEHVVSSSHQLTGGHRRNFSVSTESVPMLQQKGETSRMGPALISRHGPSRSATCTHPTASGRCSDPGDRRGQTLKGIGAGSDDTAAGAANELGPTGADSRKESATDAYSNANSNFGTSYLQQSADFPRQEENPKVPPQLDVVSSVTDRTIINSSADVAAETPRPEGSSESSSITGIEACADFETGPNGPNVEGRKDAYEFGDSITLSCARGTQLQPHVERMFCLGRHWSEPELPICVPLW
ncbi:fibrillin-2-like [Dermacentor albipictus]|uniref:fibrillin-2-like n=1 Tax=Dermacentor albipictus TaxID=60249 RepID=UPI0038FCEF1C